MAMMNCPECGKEVSSAAPSCPHCGFPLATSAKPAPSPRRGMSPWKIIGWIFLAFLLLIMWSCMKAVSNRTPDPGAATSAAASPSVPSYSVTIVSTECQNDYGRDSAEITIRNTGPEIPYAKGFVEFHDKAGKVLSAQDSYFTPHTIPAGATASMTAYSSGGGAIRCGLTTIQDGDGNRVSIQ